MNSTNKGDIVIQRIRILEVLLEGEHRLELYHMSLLQGGRATCPTRNTTSLGYISRFLLAPITLFRPTAVFYGTDNILWNIPHI
jgi:hypothetical protein